MSPRTIVVVDTMGGLGDLLLALPMIHGLAATHPRAALHVVTTAPWHVLLEGDPALASVTPVPGRDESTVRAAVDDALTRLRPDLAITTSRQYGLPELLEARADRAITDLWRNPPADELVDRRYARILVDEGVLDPAFTALPPRLEVDADELVRAEALLRSVAPDGVPVLLFPDAGMAVKRWPVRVWTGLVTALRLEGRSPVVVTESAPLRDRLVLSKAAALPDVSIRELAAIAAAAALRGGAAVGGDTGPVRVATAVGLPAVGLFGATLATRYGLREPQSLNLQGLPECEVRRPTAITEQPCWWTGECPLTRNDDLACMRDIRPDQVLTAVETLLAREPEPV